MKQRWYKVVFETIERKPIRRTVTVCSTDSVHASALVYQQFGRKKINSQLKEQNKHLNMVILSVCSKSVRDRKNAEGGKDAQTETGGKQTTLEKETGTENETATEDRRTSVSSEV